MNKLQDPLQIQLNNKQKLMISQFKNLIKINLNYHL